MQPQEMQYLYFISLFFWTTQIAFPVEAVTYLYFKCTICTTQIRIIIIFAEEFAEVTVGSQNAEEDEFVAEKRRALNILKSVVQDGIEKIEDKKERVKLKYFKYVFNN